ncbi:MAG TPA: GNAT family N-acetyltransferase [Vicinamibacterales bacterium]|nr:GNAT family N-acetyltransferase [Vicinamibacterales bacterium]
MTPGSSVAIVDLEPAHLPQLMEVVRLNDQTLPQMMCADVTRWLEAGRPPQERYFSGIAAGEPIAMTGFRPDPWGVKNISWLVWLYVHPAWKRRGVARSLFTHAQNVLRQQGCRKVYLDVGNEIQHRAAIAFHEADGFVREGYLRDYWAEGEDFLVFGKRL